VCWPDSGLVESRSSSVNSRTAAVTSECMWRSEDAFPSQLGIASPIRFRRGSNGSYFGSEVGLQTLWAGVRDLDGS